MQFQQSHKRLAARNETRQNWLIQNGEKWASTERTKQWKQQCGVTWLQRKCVPECSAAPVVMEMLADDITSYLSVDDSSISIDF